MTSEWESEALEFDERIGEIDLAADLPEVATASKAARVRYIGNRDLIGRSAVGFCGSRDSTERSLELACKFGEAAASLDFAVITGNARGVDEAAAFGALEADGSTVAVLAEGLGGWRPRLSYRGHITPSNFVAVSKYDDDARWVVYRAMDRNKLIVALSDALVVVQASAKGGSLEAGKACLKQQKPLFVVQPDGDASGYEGNSKLIGKGAIAVTTEEDLYAKLEELRDGALQPAGQGHLDL